MNSRTRCAMWLMGSLAPLVQATAAQAPAAQMPGEKNCAALGGLTAPGYQVDTAQWVPASHQAAGTAGATVAVPAHCLFRVTIGARASGIEGMRYGTGIELRLPAEWNQRLLFQGGGGLNGVLNPAFGNVSGFASALGRGFAVVSTDSGHRGRNSIDTRFGVDQQAKLDFAYQAVERTTHEAKGLLQRYYGRKPEYSYYMGCSTGGREAMMAAQRLPLEFDGVVAGNPSFNLTRVAVNQVWSLQTVNRIAPRDAQGRPLLDQAFTDAQLKAVAAAVLQQCDALDGLQDGMVNDYKACRFDPRSQVCKAGDAGNGQCLTAAQAEGLQAIMGGARNSRGESLYGSFPYDTGIAAPAWRSMHLGSPTSPPANASLGRDTLREFSITPSDTTLDPLKFDFDRDMARTEETAAINDAVAALLTSFAGHGGKMIVYHGLSDQAMATGALTAWYERLSPRTAAGPQDWARLFLIPGMTHCGGGQSTDQFDMLTAIQEWVEKNHAPDRVIASGRAFPETTRPLCPFPKVARYDSGDVKAAASFSCR
ncbi:MAG TPA: tannase/feruloyl esterase family alpha/beta hydrolase [Steroidobacteraceae bacterium]|nr:tannase/feruloyl esterase family alpha/beta hydrolase [Steroidobacteraceae bacterium]